MHAPTPRPVTPSTIPLIGVFDSGLGGLSVLRALQAQRPGTALLYLADSGHAPYGERTDAYVVERSQRIADHLVRQGADLLVMACNTATAVAAAGIRERWPHVPLVGVEPAVKPAVKASPGGRIGVMATPITLRSDKFKRLLEAHGAGADIRLQPCPGLAGMIERGDLNAPDLLALIEAHCRPLKDAGVDTVVIGCTHYTFVREHIQAAMGPAVRLIDTSEAVARHALRLLDATRAPMAPADEGASAPHRVHLQTTAEAGHLARIARSWLGFEGQVSFAEGV